MPRARSGPLAALQARRTCNSAGYETFVLIEVDQLGPTRKAISRLRHWLSGASLPARSRARYPGALHATDRKGPDLRCRVGENRAIRGLEGVAAATSTRLLLGYTSKLGAPRPGPAARTSAWSPACRRCAGTEVTVTGQESHAGTTPMPRRHDALSAPLDLSNSVNWIVPGNFPKRLGTLQLFRRDPRFAQRDPRPNLSSPSTCAIPMQL